MLGLSPTVGAPWNTGTINNNYSSSSSTAVVVQGRCTRTSNIRTNLCFRRSNRGRGRVQTESASKIETMIIKALIGPWSKRVPLRFLGSEEMNACNAKIKN